MSEKDDFNSPVSTKGDVTSVVYTVAYTVPGTTVVESTALSAGAAPVVAKAAKSLRTPLSDPSVSWIYDMNKDALVAEMAKYGLLTIGSVETLRRRFCTFWRSPATQLANPTEGLEHELRPSTLALNESVSPTKLKRPASVLPPRTTFQILNDELVSTREILGLSPNADSGTVRRLLISLATGPTRSAYDSETNIRGREPSTVPEEREDHAEFSHRDTHSHNSPRMERSKTERALPDAFTSGNATCPTPNRDDSRVFQDRATLCQTVRKWNLKFNGSKDPISFIERLEELVDAYEIPKDEMVKALPELLIGSALLWYRNTKELLVDYPSFRRHFDLQFLPAGYNRNLDDEVRMRTQGDGESFREYMTALNTLLRRSGTFSMQGRLDLIYRNMRPEYKIMVRPRDCTSLADLVERAEEYEAYERDTINFRPPPSPALALVPETAYVGKGKTPSLQGHASEERGPTPLPLLPRSFTKEKPRKTQDRVVDGTGPTAARPRGQQSRRVQPSGQERPRLCWNCGREGHFSRDCDQPRRTRDYRNQETQQMPLNRQGGSGNAALTLGDWGALRSEVKNPERANASGNSGLNRYNSE